MVDTLRRTLDEVDGLLDRLDNLLASPEADRLPGVAVARAVCDVDAFRATLAGHLDRLSGARRTQEGGTYE